VSKEKGSKDKAAGQGKKWEGSKVDPETDVEGMTWRKLCFLSFVRPELFRLPVWEGQNNL